MPEVRFTVKWPDGKEESCYSPSSIIRDYLTEGEQYTLRDFLDLTEKGLNEASERVRQKYGFACSSAMDQLQRIHLQSKSFHNTPDPKVTISSMK